MKNTFILSKIWFDFAFENPDKINCNHTALYFFILDKSNRLGHKDKIGLPTIFTMESLNIKSKNTYYKLLNDLINYGFIKLVQKSLNQNTSTIIAIVSADSKNKSALDTATIQHISQQEDSTVVSTVPINKPINNKTNKPYITKEELKQELEKFIEKWNITFKSKRRVTPDIITAYEIKRKKYTKEDFALAFNRYIKTKMDGKVNGEFTYMLEPLSFITQKNGFVKYL